MSKKRGRSDENHGARGVAHGPDPAIEAEGLLFELALDDNENSATTGGQLDSKRIKTKVIHAYWIVQQKRTFMANIIRAQD